MKTSLDSLSTISVNKLRFNPNFVKSLTNLYEDKLRIEEANEYQDALDPLYSANVIDSRLTNILLTNCKDLVDNKNQFKNQENFQKIQTILTLLEEHTEASKKRLQLEIKKIASVLPLKDKFAILNHSDHFYEKSLRNFA